MQAKIYSNRTLIGSVSLRITDESMGVLSGEFIPNQSYMEIRNKVWKFNSANKKDFDLWYGLGLNSQLENGYFIHAIGGISIWDVQELKDEKIEIDIAGVFRHVIDDFFKLEPPRLFVEEPWEDITIEKKNSFRKRT